MINILHLYYDLLNLYGENANTRCIIRNLELNNIKTKIDYKSINDKIDFEKYDLIYIGQGSEDNLKLALKDLLKRKMELNKYIESNKYLILTGNSIDMFGRYIKEKDTKIEALKIFDFYTKFIEEVTFKNASTDRLVGEIYATTPLIKEKIIGFQNRCDLNINIKTPLFKLDNNYSNFSNDLNSKNEGFTYKNVYATHTIGPILIRNPFFTNYILKKLCDEKNLEYKSLDTESIDAYKKYLSNFS